MCVAASFSFLHCMLLSSCIYDISVRMSFILSSFNSSYHFFCVLCTLFFSLLKLLLLLQSHQIQRCSKLFLQHQVSFLCIFPCHRLEDSVLLLLPLSKALKITLPVLVVLLPVLLLLLLLVLHIKIIMIIMDTLKYF